MCATTASTPACSAAAAGVRAGRNRPSGRLRCLTIPPPRGRGRLSCGRALRADPRGFRPCPARRAGAGDQPRAGLPPLHGARRAALPTRAAGLFGRHRAGGGAGRGAGVARSRRGEYSPGLIVPAETLHIRHAEEISSWAPARITIMKTPRGSRKCKIFLHFASKAILIEQFTGIQRFFVPQRILHRCLLSQALFGLRTCKVITNVSSGVSHGNCILDYRGFLAF